MIRSIWKEFWAKLPVWLSQPKLPTCSLCLLSSRCILNSNRKIQISFNLFLFWNKAPCKVWESLISIEKTLWFLQNQNVFYSIFYVKLLTMSSLSELNSNWKITVIPNYQIQISFNFFSFWNQAPCKAWESLRARG